MIGKQEAEKALLTLFSLGHVMSWLSKFPAQHRWPSVKVAVGEFVAYANSLTPPTPPTTVHCCTKQKLFELDPDHEVYVGRPSKWGNPFKLRRPADRKLVVQLYEDWVLGKITKPVLAKRGVKQVKPSFTVDDIRRELKGKRLYCWCHPKACHADVLARLADSA